MDLGSAVNHFDCFACCCPCFVDGASANIVSSQGANDSCCGAMCLVTCCCGPIGTMLTRSQVRQAIGESDDAATMILDCLVGWFTCNMCGCLSAQAKAAAREKFPAGAKGSPQGQEMKS
uniref:Uncharacterized protein n=1 Tax=Aplanochytrium stocchinoi TaxID=215587 RepID=A0A7S3UXP3_9STRA|mmetsp:Transcript_18378/g.22509  ORF Transcript_18378/g.22509 Transcript_18378/m.22509 type:complete len:119 (+) Transcript_18378:350-706(+)